MSLAAVPEDAWDFHLQTLPSLPSTVESLVGQGMQRGRVSIP